MLGSSVNRSTAAGGGEPDLAEPKKTGLYRSLFPCAGLGTNVMLMNKMYLIPFGIRAGRSFAFTGFGIQSAAAGNFRFAIASTDAAGDPDAVLFESGAIASAGVGSVTGAMSHTIAPTIDSLYWLAVVGDTNSVVSTVAPDMAMAQMLWGMPSGGLNGMGGYTLDKSRNYSSGAILLADLALSGYTAVSRCPGLFFKWTET